MTEDEFIIYNNHNIILIFSTESIKENNSILFNIEYNGYSNIDVNLLPNIPKVVIAAKKTTIKDNMKNK